MEIEVRTTPTLNDYLRFQRYIGVRDVTTWIYIALSSIPLLFLLALLLMPPQPGEGSRRGTIIFFSFFVLLGFVVNPILMARRRRKRFTIDPNLHQPRTFRFSNNGFVLTRAEKDIKIPWGDVSRATLHGGLLMLFSQRLHAWVVPLRDIRPDVQHALFSLIRQHVRRTRF